MANAPSYNGSGTLIALFIFAHTFVWICSVLVMITIFLSPNLQRHATWHNLKISWILACFSFALLFTTGQLYKPKPNFGICLVQAAAVYSVPSLTAEATLAFAISLFLRVRSGVNSAGRGNKLCAYSLLCIPYIQPTFTFVAIIIYGLQNRNQVILAPNWMTCGVRDPRFGQVTSIINAAVLLPTIVIEGFTIAIVFKNRRSYGEKIFQSLVRLCIFTMFGVFGIAVSIAFTFFVSTWDGAIKNLLLALPPLSFIFLFGLQKDIFLAWAFWRKPDPAPSQPFKQIEDEEKNSKQVYEAEVLHVRVQNWKRM